MTQLLDTSAIIGWLEQLDSSLPTLLDLSEEPVYHPVTLGELSAGVERATTDAERHMRANTLQFTMQRLRMLDGEALPAEHFGFLTAHFSRKLSHNDFWIVASTIARPGLTLVTEDRKLFDVVTSDEFATTVGHRSWVRPACLLAESKSVPPEPEAA